LGAEGYKSSTPRQAISSGEIKCSVQAFLELFSGSGAVAKLLHKRLIWVRSSSVGTPMIIHFEFSGSSDWEAMGSGIGAGEDPVGAALAELRSLHGGNLPAGRYRYIEARAGDARWGRFEIGAGGEFLV
jgi:hypothetical protein